MASISSVGIGSGVLTSDLIEKLASAEREPATKRLDLKEEKVSTQLSDMGRIKNALSDIRIAARVLKNSDAIQARSASSSSSSITVSADDAAPLGNHTINVTQLAEAHVLSSAFTLSDANQTSVGTGTLTISDGTKTANIDISNNNNTLSGIANAINNVSGLNITATVLNTTGSNYKLMLTSDETGVDNAMTITVSDDGDGDSADNSGLSRLINTHMTENNVALDAKFAFNNINLERSSNTISDVLSGVTLTLNDETGGDETISIARDSSMVADRVQEFVDKYNEFKSIVEETTDFNVDTGQAGSLLGNASLAMVDRQIINLFGKVVTGLSTAKVRSLTELGINTDSDTGLLSFSASTFNSVIAAAEEDVAALLGEDGRTSDSQVSFVSATDKTQVGTYDVNVTQMAKRGEFVGRRPFGNITVNEYRDTFKITVNGVTSGTINIDQRAYSGPELAAEVEAKINQDSILLANGLSVESDVTLDGYLRIRSSTYGEDSSVSFAEIDSDMIGTWGISNTYMTDVPIASTVTIGPDNDEFVVEVNGVRTDPFTIQNGTFNVTQLKNRIINAVNVDPNIVAAGISTSSRTNTDNTIQFYDQASGVGSTFDFISVHESLAETAGIRVRSASQGLDVKGTINGVEAIGEQRRLTGAVGDPSEGISVDVIGGTVGNRGDVTYIKGVATQLVDMINGYLSSDGAVAGVIDGYNDTLSDIDEDRIELDDRVNALTARLARQFTAMDIIISQLKNTETFVKSQLAALSGGNSDQ